MGEDIKMQQLQINTLEIAGKMDKSEGGWVALEDVAWRGGVGL